MASHNPIPLNNGSYLQQADPQSFPPNPTPASSSAGGYQGQPAQSSGNSDVPKDEVGWYFVEQYYTTLNKTPERLHLFYNKTSSFVWGTEGELLQLAHGRPAIQEKISSYEFKDCKVRVSNVDSQESADNGIVIQVLGEMSNNGLPNRKFSQTFFLAEQPNGYFVLNDIFRYLKDDEDTDSGDFEYVADEAAAESSVEAAGAAETVANEIVEVVEDLSLKETATAEIVIPQEKSVIEETATVEPVVPAPDTQGLPPPVNGDGQTENGGPSTESVEAGPEVKPVPELKPEPESEPEPKVEEPVPQPPPVEVVPPVVEEKKVASTPVREPERAPVVAPPPPPIPAVPPKTTWASVAKSGTISPAHSVSSIPPTTPQTPQTQHLSQTQSTPVSTPTTTASTPTTPGGGAPWQTARNSKPTSVSSGTTTGQTLAYVKNVSEGVPHQALKEALTKFGPLKSFEINKQKNCAFVEFETSGGFSAAQAANPHRIADATIYVEERRPRGASTGFTGGRGPFARDSRPGSQSGRSGFQQRESPRSDRGSNRGGRGYNTGTPRGGGAGNRPAGSTTSAAAT